MFDKDRIRRRWRRVVCAVIGHRPVGVTASWYERRVTDADWQHRTKRIADALCARCRCTLIPVVLPFDTGIAYVDGAQTVPDA
jgi:hypothetical protein